MAHEIEGNYAFFGSNTPAWHGLGTVLTDAPSIQEAWSMAYPFQLLKCPLETYVEVDGERHRADVAGHACIVRNDGKQLGIVGEGYELEQPIDVLSFFEPYIESGLVELEAGGSLKEGRRMWALGKVKQSEVDIVPGDTVKAHLLAATSFDGSMSKLIKWVDTRVVCANTLAVARREISTEYRIKHTKNMKSKIADAQAHVAATLENHRQATKLYKALAAKPMTHGAMVTYVRNVLAPEVLDKDYTPQLRTKVDLVTDLLESQRGLDLVPAARGTAWQAYNAVSDYVTHHAGRNEDNRLNNQWFDAATIGLNSRAMELALAA